MDYRSDPCRIKSGLSPSTHAQERLTVKEGEEGIIWEWSTQQCYVVIDRTDRKGRVSACS